MCKILKQERGWLTSVAGASLVSRRGQQMRPEAGRSKTMGDLVDHREF